ncbi:MAG: exo-alpha-sialidase [Verrucomicrobia bacterium]|nr:exo-alpha-sialidase [Verrucomicrobiota bacterium]MBU1856135.1 exo-alpha-sialidase [Verrucomicrobiota bacterium]
MQKIEYDIWLKIITEGYDRKSEWFQPRIGIVPPDAAILTMTKAQLWGSDIFQGTYLMRSDDHGQTWSKPVNQENLQRRPLPDGAQVCPCDLTPQWHAVTEKMLLTGHTAVYDAGEKGNLQGGNAHERQMVYAVYDEKTGKILPWEALVMPDHEKFYWCSGGCAQRVDLPNGEILLPVAFMGRESVGEDFWKSCFITTVVRCGFDGARLTYLEHGDELSVPVPRGFCEPSLVFFDGRFFLTLRNDEKGYVTTGQDGLHYDKVTPWVFDDGQELGSYNTQQHWVTLSSGLFLVYTRRGAKNDRVIRHRAPLFMAQVDPGRLCVIKETERILVPDYGAQHGNFGTLNAWPDESWVVTSEGMHGDAKDYRNLELTERRGANNRVYLCRIVRNGTK